MSEYVEARYAKLILDEARLAEQDVASKLVKELLRDLSSQQRLNCASAQTVSSIRLLALSLDGAVNRFTSASGTPQTGRLKPGAKARSNEKTLSIHGRLHDEAMPLVVVRREPRPLDGRRRRFNFFQG